LEVLFNNWRLFLDGSHFCTMQVFRYGKKVMASLLKVVNALCT